MSELIVKDDYIISRVADGDICSEVTLYKNGNLAISAQKIEIGSGD